MGQRSLTGAPLSACFEDRGDLLDGMTLLLHGTPPGRSGWIVPQNSHSDWAEFAGAHQTANPSYRFGGGCGARLLKPRDRQMNAAPYKRASVMIMTYCDN